jgi:predicted translin family RNA/ssDNA-binding protein
MIDKKIFTRLRKDLAKKDLLREKLILDSRPVIKYSKQVIYALHKNSLSDAEKNLEKAKNSFKQLNKIVKDNFKFSIGAYNAALQEYTEAITYYFFVTENKLVSNQELGIDAENYLLGICDLTGELARRAVFAVVNENFSEILKIRKLVETIHNEFLEFELRNSELRKKSDSIKWNMKKIEEIMYDLKIRGKL